MVTRTSWFLQIALIGVAPWCVHELVNAAEPSSPALTLLYVGGKPSIDSFDAALQQYAALQAGTRSDLRVSYAMTLVAIRHHKARDAMQLIDVALATKPNNLHLRQVRLWIRCWNKDYKTALAEMPAIAKDIAAAGKSDKASQLQIDEQSRTLGMLIAFLRGPAEGALDKERVAAIEGELRKLLPPENHEAFMAGQKSVDEKQHEIANVLQTAQAKAKANSDAKRLLELAKLKQFQAICKIDVSQVQPQSEIRAVVLSARLKVLRQRNQDSDRVTVTRGGQTSTEGPHDGQIRKLSDEIANLPNAAAAKLEQLNTLLKRTEEQIAELEKKIETEAEIKLAEDVNTKDVRKRMAMLSTYYEFPFDVERDKLVASFSKR